MKPEHEAINRNTDKLFEIRAVIHLAASICDLRSEEKQVNVYFPAVHSLAQALRSAKLQVEAAIDDLDAVATRINNGDDNGQLGNS